jgi:hypothetical protein
MRFCAIKKGSVMTDAPSSDGALEEVTGYVGLVLSADDVRSLYEVLAVPRLDTAMVPVTYQARLPRGSANGNETQDDSS